MIASLAAVGLAPGIGSTGGTGGRNTAPERNDGSPVPAETPLGLQSYESPERTIDPTKSYKAVFSTDQGDIVVALNPEAPEAANSLAFLAGQNFYDGLEFFWVKPGFTAQTGDPTCESSGMFSCSGAGGPGYTLPLEGDSSKAGKWSVIAPVTLPGSDQVHGSQLVFALTDDADFEGSIVGTVVEGQDILTGLQERVPCFGAAPSEANPCQPDEELPQALIIQDVVVQPA